MNAYGSPPWSWWRELRFLRRQRLDDVASVARLQVGLNRALVHAAELEAQVCALRVEVDEWRRLAEVRVLGSTDG